MLGASKEDGKSVIKRFEKSVRESHKPGAQAIEVRQGAGPPLTADQGFTRSQYATNGSVNTVLTRTPLIRLGTLGKSCELTST